MDDRPALARLIITKTTDGRHRWRIGETRVQRVRHIDVAALCADAEDTAILRVVAVAPASRAEGAVGGEGKAVPMTIRRRAIVCRIGAEAGAGTRAISTSIGGCGCIRNGRGFGRLKRRCVHGGP